jgi:hypothetical protein
MTGSVMMFLACLNLSERYSGETHADGTRSLAGWGHPLGSGWSLTRVNGSGSGSASPGVGAVAFLLDTGLTHVPLARLQSGL